MILKAFNKVFGGLKMSWTAVLIFSVVTGVYTGVINQIPALHDTSFTDIAVTYEWWILFAVIIVSNCKKSWEAALKVFLFFMVSQPLVFLVELPMIGWDLAWGYYQSWFIRILLTLPGGFIAFFIKKNNALGAIILSVATAILGATTIQFVGIGHYLSAIFCVLQIIVYLLVFTKKISSKIIVIVLTLLAVGGTGALLLTIQNTTSGILPEGTNWTCQMTVEDGTRVEISDQSFTYYYNSYTSKDKELIFTNDNGEVVKYKVENGKISKK